MKANVSDTETVAGIEATLTMADPLTSVRAARMSH